MNETNSNGNWTVRQDDQNGLTPGGAGSAIIYSDQPVAAFVNEFAPHNTGDATSYTDVGLSAGTQYFYKVRAVAPAVPGGIGPTATGGQASRVGPPPESAAPPRGRPGIPRPGPNSPRCAT